MKISQRVLDKRFMQLAFDKAYEHLGSTKENPSVGCVVVKNNTVISSGKTSLNGRPHAETNALNKKKFFNGSTIYVTLEPCSHHGLTPPCIDIIKKKNVKKEVQMDYRPIEEYKTSGNMNNLVYDDATLLAMQDKTRTLNV